MAPRTTTLVLLLMTSLLVDDVTSTRCYMCRDVVQRSGNRRRFLENYSKKETEGWIRPCSDDTFVVFPQVYCAKRTYLTYEFCYPDKKCTVKVIERYPLLPPSIQNLFPQFFKNPYNVDTLKDNNKTCQNAAPPGDLCNGDYKNEYKEGLKCYHQCGKIQLYGLSEQELENYDLPVIPCDQTTYNYCGDEMECGYIRGSAVYTDDALKRYITVEGWYADCFYRNNNSIDHVLQTIRGMMSQHPSLQISPEDLNKCDSDLCNYID